METVDDEMLNWLMKLRKNHTLATDCLRHRLASLTGLRHRDFHVTKTSIDKSSEGRGRGGGGGAGWSVTAPTHMPGVNMCVRGHWITDRRD